MQAVMPTRMADMAHEMGHGDADLAAMVRDMRRRFLICLCFTVPIFVYAPMARMFKPPAPPLGLDLGVWLFLLATAAIVYPSWPFFVSAWRGRFSEASLLIAIVCAEILVLAANHMRCPRTAVAARYTANRADNFDICLPLWLARYNKQVFGALFVAGLLVTLALWLADAS